MNGHMHIFIAESKRTEGEESRRLSSFPFRAEQKHFRRIWTVLVFLPGCINTAAFSLGETFFITTAERHWLYNSSTFGNSRGNRDIQTVGSERKKVFTCQTVWKDL